MLRWLLVIVLVVGVAAGIVVGALNPDLVDVDLAVVEWTASLGTVLVVAFSAGFLLGIAAFGFLSLLRAPGRRKKASTGAASGKQLENA
jgi:uncharacterized membrane protein YciS (DUF1049 family)